MFFFFFFNDTATTEIYTLSLHDALPIFEYSGFKFALFFLGEYIGLFAVSGMAITLFLGGDRKSTRLNSSHDQISYAVFCLKKKKDPGLHTPALTCHVLLLGGTHKSYGRR